MGWRHPEILFMELWNIPSGISLVRRDPQKDLESSSSSGHPNNPTLCLFHELPLRTSQETPQTPALWTFLEHNSLFKPIIHCLEPPTCPAPSPRCLWLWGTPEVTAAPSSLPDLLPWMWLHRSQTGVALRECQSLLPVR